MNDRYQKLAIDAGYAKYMVDPLGGHHMCFQPYYTDMEKYRPITDLIMATYGTTYRWLTWGLGEDILSTHLPYPKPKETLAHEEIFHSDVIYGSEHCCLEFSEAGMFDPLTTHNAERLSRVKIKLDKLLGLQMTTQSFEDAVEAAIRGAIESGQVSSHIVAERLGLSWSDLRTKLNETGRSFRPRLDQIRKTMFIEKYETGKSFSQIAMSLAYNDQAAMNRAFRRWFGMTPSDWRRRQAQEKL